MKKSEESIGFYRTPTNGPQYMHYGTPRGEKRKNQKTYSKK